MTSLPEPLVALVSAWRAAVRTPRRRAMVAAAVLVIAIALLVARAGTWEMRGGAVGVLVAAAVALVLLARRETRMWGDADRAIDRVAGRVDPARAARARRALTLLDPSRAQDDGTSRELAQLHAVRAVAALPADAIRAGANRVAFRFASAALAASLAVMFIAVALPWPILEGADVMLARHGVAPMPMTWLEDPEIRSRPPDYLHQTERDATPFAALELPRGTLLTYRGSPARSGRRLVLTDGDNEVPFIDDGQGRMVARWPVAETASLSVVARFGDVSIPERDATRVISIPDQVPVVTLEDAPKRIELAKEEGLGSIPIRYQATDDHGLREVHLVLRSGGREERRVLARLDGETRMDKGGSVLRVTDPFVKKSHVPVEVRVEAKDNDPITGPKWGASEAITIVPPDVGEPQAKRLEALRKLRDRLVDSLAWRMEHAVPAAPADRRAMIADEIKTVDDDAELIDATLASTYAGVRIAGRAGAELRGKMRRVRDAMDKEARVVSPQTHAGLVKASERLALVVDAIVRGRGLADSRDVALQLADVADDAALAEAEEARADPNDAERQTARGKDRADSDAIVLEGGSRSLARLGELGRDLGEIVGADLSRIARARGGEDWARAELAARDLEARLREPDPSFGSRGGSGGQSGGAGGEAGGSHGTPGEDSEGAGDEVDRAFQQEAKDLEQLAQDHATNQAKAQQSLAQGASEEDMKSVAGESKKHAEQVRDAVRDLPTVGGAGESSSGRASAAKEQAEQMAHSLEEGSPNDAVSTGRSALQALDEAKRAAQNESWRSMSGKPSNAEKAIDEARKKLEPEVAWAEQKAQDLKKRAAERAKGDLSKSGDEENALAERAKQLRQRGQDMPGGATDALEEAEKSMRKAAEALKASDPDKASDAQREAQRQLEMAGAAMGGDKDDDGEGRGNEGDGSNADETGKASIPNADEHKGPEDFRRRVTEGLGMPSGKWKDAARRYAEGLLR